MIDRIMPIFAVIGILSSAAYLSLAVWLIYEKLSKKKRLPMQPAHRHSLTSH